MLMKDAASGAIFPEYEAPVLMLCADCSLFTLKPACSSRYLPPWLIAHAGKLAEGSTDFD